jgi:uncharacterized membrane protein (GlpM family)
LRRVPLGLAAVVVPVILLIGPLAAEGVATDVGWLALLLLAALGVQGSLRETVGVALQRIAGYVVAVIGVYLISTHVDLGATFTMAMYAAFAALAFGIALWARFAASRSFELNGLDFIVVLVVAVVPNLAGVASTGLGVSAIQALILFYAVELILAERGWGARVYLISVITALAVLAARGLFGAW